MPIDSSIQQGWATWKYFVMSRSQQQYNDIRQLFSSNQWSDEKESSFYFILAESQQTTPSLGSLRNAYQHVWGYFKKAATSEEKEAFQTNLAALTMLNDPLKPFLRELTIKYDIPYLLASKLLFDE